MIDLGKIFGQKAVILAKFINFIPIEILTVQVDLFIPP